jgi:hypothetical protein
MSTVTASMRGRLERWAPLAGIVYVALAIVAIAFVLRGPDTSGNPQKLIDYYSTSSHRRDGIIGALFFMAAIFFFLWFLAALRTRLSRFDDGILSSVVLLGGGLYAALSSAAFILWGGTEQLKVNSTHPVHPELLQLAGDVSWFLNSTGFIGGAALVIAASVIALRAAVVPSWLGWLSVAAGIVLLVSFFGFPEIIWAVWVLTVSVGLFRGERAATSAGVAAAAARGSRD